MLCFFCYIFLWSLMCLLLVFKWAIFKCKIYYPVIGRSIAIYTRRLGNIVTWVDMVFQLCDLIFNVILIFMSLLPRQGYKGPTVSIHSTFFAIGYFLDLCFNIGGASRACCAPMWVISLSVESLKSDSTTFAMMTALMTTTWKKKSKYNNYMLECIELGPLPSCH